MSKHYVLKRYYPNIEDDDNSNVIYVTDSYKDAVEKANETAADARKSSAKKGAKKEDK